MSISVDWGRKAVPYGSMALILLSHCGGAAMPYATLPKEGDPDIEIRPFRIRSSSGISARIAKPAGQTDGNRTVRSGALKTMTAQRPENYAVSRWSLNRLDKCARSLPTCANANEPRAESKNFPKAREIFDHKDQLLEFPTSIVHANRPPLPETHHGPPSRRDLQDAAGRRGCRA